MDIQELRRNYGGGIYEVLSYWKKYFGDEKFEPTPTPIQNPPAPPPIQNLREMPPIQNQPKGKNKFSPVNIADSKDWEELRAVALDLHELTNFFVGKQDSQSPKFISQIENYKKFLDKKLATPEVFDENSSFDFVEKLAKEILNRLYTILEACHNSLRGKSTANPESYYREILNRFRKYFANIGLHSAEARPKDDFRRWQEHMKASTIPTIFIHQDNTISEVFVQPHYFEYYNDDGDMDQLWIDGRCTVYKVGRD